MFKCQCTEYRYSNLFLVTSLGPGYAVTTVGIFTFCNKELYTVTLNSLKVKKKIF